MQEWQITLWSGDLARRGLFLLSLLLFGTNLAIYSDSTHGSDVCGDIGGIDKRDSPRKFSIFDATAYLKKPDLSSLGIKPMKILDRGFWAQENYREAPDRDRVKAVVDKFPKDAAAIVLDIEHWPVRGDAAVVSASISKLHAVIAMFKMYAPYRMFGYFSLLPIRDYWRAIQGSRNPKYHEWQVENDVLVSLERDVDVMFPSVYTFYDDRAGWLKYAEAQICEARRISKKPVFAFLWPEYHNSNAKLKGTFVDAAFWRLQLDTMRKYADGVVIWGGWDLALNRAREWDDNAEWWQQTKEFAIQLKSSHVTP